MADEMKALYADNGAGGDNVRFYVTRRTTYDPLWNPLYCVYGWPHIIWPTEESCFRCGARRHVVQSPV